MGNGVEMNGDNRKEEILRVKLVELVGDYIVFFGGLEFLILEVYMRFFFRFCFLVIGVVFF